MILECPNCHLQLSLHMVAPEIRPAELPAVIRALEFYIHDDLVDAFPGDDVILATLLARLKEHEHGPTI